MFHIEEEIASQPRCFERAVEFARRHDDRLPRRGERVAVVGCGSAWNVGQVYSRLREESGQGETDAFIASEMQFGRNYDRYVFISRSGTTTETVECLAAFPKDAATIAITAEANSPLARGAQDALVIDFARERSVVETRFVTSVMLLLRVHLGDDPIPAIEMAEAALTSPIPDGALTARQFTFLGRGGATGVAHEAALKMKETAQVWSEAYATLEYRHGPIAVAERGSLVWAIGAVPPSLAAEIRATGATFYTSGRDPLADLVVVQRTAVERAVRSGQNPDSPRHLTYSVVYS